VSQITLKILLLQKNSNFPAVREIVEFLVTHKIRLIIYLSFHKKLGLKPIEKKLKFSEEKFFFNFTAALVSINLHYGYVANNRHLGSLK
jgi:hypothetical protein